jgi:hypothetical protein
VRISSIHKAFVLFSLLLWLMSSWTGVHGHFCFDGQEPPVSLHVDVIGHQTHELSESHQDIDQDAAQSALVKHLKFDPLLLPVLLAAIYVLLAVHTTQLFFFHLVVQHPRCCNGFRPPLRAPPVTLL